VIINRVFRSAFGADDDAPAREDDDDDDIAKHLL
jgi:hypothetical protein